MWEEGVVDGYVADLTFISFSTGLQLTLSSLTFNNCKYDLGFNQVLIQALTIL